MVEWEKGIGEGKGKGEWRKAEKKEEAEETPFEEWLV